MHWIVHRTEKGTAPFGRSSSVSVRSRQLLSKCTITSSAAPGCQGVAAFLRAATGADGFVPPAEPTFSDVPTWSPFFADIEWLVAEGIANGYPDGTFRPTLSVSRQGVAAMLHQAFAA